MFTRIFIVSLLLLALSGCAPAPAVQPDTPVSAATPTAATVLTPSPQPTAPQQPTKPATHESGTMKHEMITSQALAGNLIGDPAKRGYNIYLPPGYADGNKRYPVLYLLHGATGNEYQMQDLADVYESMLRLGRVQEMILVFPNGDNKFGASNYISSPTIGDYETT